MNLKLLSLVNFVSLLFASRSPEIAGNARTLESARNDIAYIFSNSDSILKDSASESSSDYSENYLDPIPIVATDQGFISEYENGWDGSHDDYPPVWAPPEVPYFSSYDNSWNGPNDSAFPPELDNSWNGPNDSVFPPELDNSWNGPNDTVFPPEINNSWNCSHDGIPPVVPYSPRIENGWNGLHDDSLLPPEVGTVPYCGNSWSESSNETDPPPCTVYARSGEMVEAFQQNPGSASASTSDSQLLDSDSTSSSTSSFSIMVSELEATILQPLLSSQNADVRFLWQMAVNNARSSENEDLLKTAEALVAVYGEFNEPVPEKYRYFIWLKTTVLSPIMTSQFRRKLVEGLISNSYSEDLMRMARELIGEYNAYVEYTAELRRILQPLISRYPEVLDMFNTNANNYLSKSDLLRDVERLVAMHGGLVKLVPELSEYAKELESTILQTLMVGWNSDWLSRWNYALRRCLFKEDLLSEAELIVFEHEQYLQYARELETSILRSSMSTRHPQFLIDWDKAIDECKESTQLREQAEALDEVYGTWNPMLEQAAVDVFGLCELRTTIFSQLSLADLTNLSLLSKNLFRCIEKYIEDTYKKEGKIDWCSVITLAYESENAERPALTRMIMKNWPKSEDPIISALLIKAQSFFGKALHGDGADEEDFLLPGIPGYFGIWMALYGSICNLDIPFEVYLYEDADIAEEFLVKGFRRNYTTDDLKIKHIREIFEAGNSKAIHNLKTVFPPFSNEDAIQRPVMTWRETKSGWVGEEYSFELCCVLAIYYHKDTIHHETLINHLATKFAGLDSSSLAGKILYLLNSQLTTADVLRVLGDTPLYDYFFVEPKRALDILATRGFAGQRIDIERLCAENFSGGYSEEMLRLMGGDIFCHVALVAGANDSVIARAVTRYHQVSVPSLVYISIEAGRSLELIVFLIKSIKNPLDFWFVYNAGRKLPDLFNQSWKPLFKEDSFAHFYAVKMVSELAHDSSPSVLTKMLKTLTPTQLYNLVPKILGLGNPSIEMKFFIELIRHFSILDKRVVIEKHSEGLCASISFKIALLSMRISTLTKMFEMAKHLAMKTLVRETINFKLEQDCPVFDF